MKRIFITFILFTCLSGPLISAEDTNKQVPDVSIGINANIGSFDLYDKNVNLGTKPGLYTGGGISLEKMIYTNFGIGTGIQYRYFNADFVMDDGATTYDATWTFQTINIPFLMILSFSGGETALNLAGGIVYSHVFYSVMETDSDAVLKKEDNVLRFTNTNQIGLTAGILFKIKATEYTDFVFGIMGEYYPTNLLYHAGDSGDRLNMTNYSLTTGYMFRTYLFPGSANKN
ncbi:MAG TPA: hypothetical protein PKG60_12945 [Spirochaetota bacterium]|nr:hypothetical protein [Spirochaetota bacterium]HPS85661.1 hypothetical protein [Spirochaetota bacterium]